MTRTQVGLWSGVAGIVIGVVSILYVFGYVKGDTAAEMANERAEVVVAEVLTCVGAARDPQNAEVLAEVLKATNDRLIIRKVGDAGWTDDSLAATLCVAEVRRQIDAEAAVALAEDEVDASTE